MNSLSWFLYLMDVYSNIRGALIAIVVVLAIIMVISAVVCAIVYSEIYNKEEAKQFRNNTKLWYSRGLIVWGIAAVCLIFTPTKNTVYAIAASEVGERIARNPDVQEISRDALDAIKGWIKTQKGENRGP